MARVPIRATLSALAAATVVAGISQAQAPSERHHRAMVAGYKAAFTCSATFLADRPRAAIEENELSGIYPDYRETLADLPPARIDDAAGMVSVAFDPDMPPRIAVHRDGFGCAQLPVGAEASQADWLVRKSGWPRPDGLDRSSALGSAVSLSMPVEIQSRLEAPISFAFDAKTYGADTRTSAVVVLHRGEVVGERYARGIGPETPQRTWSVAKSITATLLGAAHAQGLIGPDSTALLEAWQQGSDPRRRISLANLLHMSSGLYSGDQGARTDAVYFGGARVVDEATTGSLIHPPGSTFQYANNDTLIALRALREAIGDDAAYHAFPYTEVLWKIGARRTILETDWNGDFVASSQVWSTARDLARIGQLYLEEGRWGGEQILSPDWVAFVRTPAPAQPQGVPYGYGAQFWLLGGASGVPSDTFAAMGHRGQYIVIVPSRDLVVVRRGYDVSGGTRFDIAAFTRDVVTAVDRGLQARAYAQAVASALETGRAERREDGTVVFLDEDGNPTDPPVQPPGGGGADQ